MSPTTTATRPSTPPVTTNAAWIALRSRVADTDRHARGALSITHAHAREILDRLSSEYHSHVACVLGELHATDCDLASEMHAWVTQHADERSRAYLLTWAKARELDLHHTIPCGVRFAVNPDTGSVQFYGDTRGRQGVLAACAREAQLRRMRIG